MGLRASVLTIALASALVSAAAGKEGETMLVDPNTILFSLPTLCGDLPELEDSEPRAGSVDMHEDLWRQIEFVSRSNAGHINQELGKLRAFVSEHRRESGYDDLYLRLRHPTMLAVEAAKIERLIGPVAGLSISGKPVPQGQAFSLGGGWHLYGQQRSDGSFGTLGLIFGETPPDEKGIEALEKLAREEQLIMVNWFDTEIVDTSSIETLRRWFNQHY